MSVYAIGDVQGCYTQLRRLLDKLNFDPSTDTVWFAGDLVNRGPESLKTLRFIRGLKDNAVCVLGNHDIHLIAAFLNVRHRVGKRDTLEGVLAADDADELVHWLQHRPMLHHDPDMNVTMVHAGIPAQWDIRQACRQARKTETVLRGSQARKLLRKSYAHTPQSWSRKLSKWERRCYSIGAFTRMRFVYPNGKLEMKHKGSPGSQTRKTVPWFEAPHARWRGQSRIVFGHWATLGIYKNDHVLGLDGGCVWGGTLVAAKLDHKEIKYTEVLCTQSN